MEGSIYFKKFTVISPHILSYPYLIACWKQWSSLHCMHVFDFHVPQWTILWYCVCPYLTSCTCSLFNWILEVIISLRSKYALSYRDTVLYLYICIYHCCPLGLGLVVELTWVNIPKSCSQMLLATTDTKSRLCKKEWHNWPLNPGTSSQSEGVQ